MGLGSGRIPPIVGFSFGRKGGDIGDGLEILGGIGGAKLSFFADEPARYDENSRQLLRDLAGEGA
jgi:hypothetical protein